MKSKYILIILSLCTILAACDKKDYYIADIKSNERAIVDLKVNKQVGPVEIIRNNDTSLVNVLIFGSNEDLKSLAPILAISYGATVEPASGTPIDFTKTADNSAVYTITSQSGEKKDWTVKVGLYNNPYEGTWSIATFRFKYDDWNGWGLSGEADVAAKMDKTAPGLDDIITFGPIEGIDESGVLAGNYERSVGADGLFGVYISALGTDWSWKFGQLPNGIGKYYINTDKTISIEIDGSGKKLTSKGSKTTDGSTMTYELNSPQSPGSEIDWNDYYGSENQLRMAFNIWYELVKQ